MLTETELLVLRGVRYSDSASIIQTYSDQYGSLSFRVSRTTRRSSSGSTRAFFVPLSTLSVTFDYHQGREIQQPKEVTPLRTLTSISTDPIVNAEALFTAELLSHLLRSQGVDRTLYRYVTEQITMLDTMELKHVASFHLRLMAGLCYHLGVIPECEGYKPGCILDVRNGHFRPPISVVEYRRQECSSLLVRLFTEANPEELPMNRQLRNDLLSVLLEYLGFHFPEISAMRSPAILADLFSS